LVSGSWGPVVSAFLLKVQNSPEFFNYYNLSDEEALELAVQRARGYLTEAAARICFDCSPDVDFLDFDPVLESFGFSLTSEEAELLACLMFEKFLEKDVARLRVRVDLFTSQDIKNTYGVTANERRSFMEMYGSVRHNNDVLIDRYISKDRLTGKRKSIFPDV